MLSMIRKRVTFANVILTLALVFAMTGGAYAAKRYLITSTKQISPSVLKALAGKAGPAGKEGAPGKGGANGAQGSQGPQGLQGVEGKLGKEGKEGEEGEEGREGKEGKPGKDGLQGQPWTPDNTLPAKATETGTWGGRPTEGQIDFVPIAFPVKLSKELEASAVHIVTVEEQKKENGKEPPAGCQGTAQAPAAEAGSLCVYEGADLLNNVEIKAIYKPYGSIEVGTGVAGALLELVGLHGEPPIYYAVGSWAVTAE